MSSHESSLRELQRWVAGYLGEIEHEQRVCRVAGTLFDLTSRRHKLQPSHRQLLRLGAIVHDVGRCKGEKNHAARGANMIRRDLDMLGSSQRRALAFLTRYHKGPSPKIDGERFLKKSDDRESLHVILALLRVADALDSRSLDSPRLVFSMRGRRILVDCYLSDDCSKSRTYYTRRKKFRMLEELLECRIDVRISVAEKLRLVA